MAEVVEGVLSPPPVEATRARLRTRMTESRPTRKVVEVVDGLSNAESGSWPAIFGLRALARATESGQKVEDRMLERSRDQLYPGSPRGFDSQVSIFLKQHPEFDPKDARHMANAEAHVNKTMAKELLRNMSRREFRRLGKMISQAQSGEEPVSFLKPDPELLESLEPEQKTKLELRFSQFEKNLLEEYPQEHKKRRKILRDVVAATIASLGIDLLNQSTKDSK